MKSHKHSNLIKAWADGAEIQWYDDSAREHRWKDCLSHFDWGAPVQFRIKPIDTVVEWLVQKNQVTYFDHNRPEEEKNIRLTFDGETGKLKSAEVL